MLDRNLRELEQHDAGLPDDSPLIARSHRVRGQSQAAILPGMSRSLLNLRRE